MALLWIKYSIENNETIHDICNSIKQGRQLLYNKFSKLFLFTEKKRQSSVRLRWHQEKSKLSTSPWVILHPLGMRPIPDFLRSSQTVLAVSESCALFRLWNLHNYISTLIQPFTPPALKNTYICENLLQWNDPSWRNAGGGSGADFLLNQTPCVSLLYPSSHDRNHIVHCVLTEELRGC